MDAVNGTTFELIVLVVGAAIVPLLLLALFNPTAVNRMRDYG